MRRARRRAYRARRVARPGRGRRVAPSFTSVSAKAEKPRATPGDTHGASPSKMAQRYWHHHPYSGHPCTGRFHGPGSAVAWGVVRLRARHEARQEQGVARIRWQARSQFYPPFQEPPCSSTRTHVPAFRLQCPHRLGF
eukprot:scaffold46735_cov52-Phaeocystis_antarctica.AAC.2